MGLKAAFAQLVVAASIFTAGTMYMRHGQATLQRADFTHSAYFEDSKAGNGTRYRVLTAAADTGGSSCSVEVLTRSSAAAYVADYPGSGPEHTHRQQHEHLTVRQGALGYIWQNKQEASHGVLRAGDTLEIPAGTAHMLFNADNSTDVLYEIIHHPSGAMGEAFFENLAGAGWDYGSVDRIHPLQVIVLFEAADTQLADMGGFLQPVVKHLVLPVARLWGFQATYPGHTSKHGGGGSPAGHANAAEDDAPPSGSSAGGGSTAEHQEL